MSTYTSGPWHVAYDDNNAPIVRAESSVTPIIAETQRFWRTYEQAEANAQLIAAAPDMVEALRECVASYVAVDHANTYTSDDTLSIVKANERIRAAQTMARATLAK